jgi:hypothetical protein
MQSEKRFALVLEVLSTDALRPLTVCMGYQIFSERPRANVSIKMRHAGNKFSAL